MITARRIRERMEAEAAGQPPPSPRPPSEIPWHEHERLLNDLRSTHAAEVEALKRQLTEMQSALAKPEPPKAEVAAEPKPDLEPAQPPVEPAKAATSQRRDKSSRG